MHNETFDQFWKSYPKKVSKKRAQKIWDKLEMTDELFSQIMDSLEAQKSSPQWQKDNGQFIPYPTTWLNGQRWEDEISQGDNDFTPAETMGLDEISPERQREIKRELEWPE